MFVYLLVLAVCCTGGLQCWRTLFDNFAFHNVGLDGEHVGVIQSVREVPGFLSLLVTYVLLIVSEHRLAALSIMVLGMGVFLTGVLPSFTGLIFTTLVMSFGFHYFQTCSQSLTLQYFNKTEAPMVFAIQQKWSAMANIAVGILIFVLSGVLDYEALYLLFGTVIIACGIWAFTRNPVHAGMPVQKKSMVVRKKYWLYYALTFMAGARRQIFVAFAVFLLVQKFDFSIQQITLLFLLNNAINFFINPLIGKAIIRFGERRVLSMEYFALILIFTAYAFTDSKMVVALLYVVDHIFFGFSMGIKTYFQKICDPADIAPSAAVGFTINHIAAVALPVIGGVLWLVDYRIPFLAGAGMSIISLTLVQLIKLPGETKALAA